MSRIFWRKLVGLGRDEDGAALIITLALFMFLYVSCAGVYAIGQSVKDRIHLQNACDAAAYSAAIVQADTLSRIATINRAMSWTYVSMVKRQQDYIVWKWLDEVKTRYHEDVLLAEEITPVLINRSQIATYDAIRFAVDDFDRKKFDHKSFYSRSGGVGVETLEQQIEDDGEALDEMKWANDDLVGKLKDRAEGAAKAVLKLNFPQGLRSSGAYCSVKIEKARSYLDYMGSGYESRFAQFSEESHGPDGFVTYPWFPVVPSSDGIGRRYEQKDSCLIAEWTWWMKVTHAQVNRIGVFGVRGWDVRDDYFKEHLACPWKVMDAYFDAAGTITVGLAKYNENPFLGILRNSPGVRDWGDKGFGILGAFNPFRYVEWSWAISSAKAGYDDAGDKSRAYKVGWNDGVWNLSVSNWDAVFIPVRKACAKAGSAKWNSEGSAFLKELVEDSGRWEPLDDDSRPPAYNVAGNMPSLPAMHSNAGAIRDLKWERMTELMFH